ncbi:MAG TPA: Arm DNA-binding domain-containing protein, partial [Dongiaceae bacterium]|nr:Arm DNA-binding domain-containing protein [Dongiaceae bacterium]
MTTVRITKRTVDAAKPGMRAGVPCDSFLFDTEIKGFGLRVKAGSGTKTYILQYRDGRGRESAKKRVTIGDLPRTSGPARMLVQGHRDHDAGGYWCSPVVSDDEWLFCRAGPVLSAGNGAADPLRC